MSLEQHRRVLVVDDDPVVRTLLTSVLRQKSLLVDQAPDGRAAIDLLRENQYAVVLLDLLMPVADGFAVLDALGQDGVSVPPVVLVITGADHSTVAHLDASKVHGILRKPVDPNEIAAVVAACSEIRGRSALETMALAVISGAPILAWLAGK